MKLELHRVHSGGWILGEEDIPDLKHQHIVLVVGFGTKLEVIEQLVFISQPEPAPPVEMLLLI